MIRSLSRRLSLKLLSSLAFLGLGTRRAPAQTPSPASEDRLDRWDRTADRVFLGGEFWANPMEDWRISGGWAECQVRSGNRSIHALTRRLENPQGTFTLSVRIAKPAALPKDGGAGFRIGIRSDLDEVRSNCFAPGGLDAGILGEQLILGKETAPLNAPFPSGECRLVLEGRPGAGAGTWDLTLSAYRPDGSVLGTVRATTPTSAGIGNIALVSQMTELPKGRAEGTSWRFADWRASGNAIVHQPENRFGPILWTMYTLSDSRGPEGFVLKLTALTGPLTAGDQRIEGFVQRAGTWQSLGSVPLDPDAWTATFRVPNWDATAPAPFKVVYQETLSDGTIVPDEWTGTIRANPSDRPLRIGALTCQNDYAFPYEPVARNLLRLDPDLLYFSGDQIYENHGGFGIIRAPAEPAILNYLRKFYQHGWAFREAMRDRPTVCIPDDHDVFQGNYWGEGGAAMADPDGGASSKGGYIQPVRMVNVVHRTNTSHHPDPYDPTPALRGMSVYYGELVYGGVGFAILGDRQFKSGPEHVQTGSGRADHVLEPDFDTAALDVPGLVLLGERQEKFLAAWGADWRGHTMKILFSQTLFANAATHHGDFDSYLKADLDSGGWPQSPRNRAVTILRESMALHVNGDQHLATLIQYGVDRQRDSNWSFCTPAIAVGYPRWWRPDEVGMPHENRPAHGLPHTGDYLEGLGNRIHVHAVGNPEVPTARHRYEKAHQKGSGFGFVTVDTKARTYTLDAFRFLVDATDGKPESQFPGWPVTLHQTENRGENRLP